MAMTEEEKTGKRIYELKEAELLKNEAMFVIAQDSLTRRVTLEKLKYSFSEDGDIKYYTSTQIYDLFDKVYDNIDEIYNDFTNLDRKVNNLSDRVEEINNKINEINNQLKESIGDVVIKVQSDQPDPVVGKKVVWIKV